MTDKIDGEQVLYFYPEGTTFQDTWLRDVSSESFVDIHKVNGLRGIYIASQLKENATAGQMSPADVVTVVSFDKGGEWKLLQPPRFDDQNQLIDCQRSAGCSLHLGQRLSQLYPVNRTAPILTSPSAVGLVVATGVVGKSMKGDRYVLFAYFIFVFSSLFIHFYNHFFIVIHVMLVIMDYLRQIEL